MSKLKTPALLLAIAALLAACSTKPARDNKPQWRSDLVRAIQRHSVIEVERILSANAASPDVPLNDNGLTPLMVAVRAGRKEIVLWLIQQGAKVNAVTKRENGTALLGACDRGHVDVIRVLVEHGANVNHADSQGWTPLLAALSQNQTATAQYLITNGANIDVQLRNGRSALMVAAERGNAELVQLLIEKGASINHTDEGGEHALLEATIAGRTDVVSLLVKKGAALDLQDLAHWTALIKAAAHGRCEIVRVLCDAGADPTKRNKFGRTALDYASGITGTNTIVTGNDVKALVDKGVIAREELYYVVERKASGRDYDCIVKVLENYQRRSEKKPEAR